MDEQSMSRQKGMAAGGAGVAGLLGWELGMISGALVGLVAGMFLGLAIRSR